MTGSRAWDGADYQARFDALAAQGVDVHGEVRFVLSFSPATALDAGCGTGRVANELARRGVDVVGVDIDPSMLATARACAPTPGPRFVEADLAGPAFHLGCTFDLVFMAGNVPLFTPPGTSGALVAGCARHIEDGGLMVTGFQLGRGYDLASYDDHCRAAGLALVERWSTWDRGSFGPDPGDPPSPDLRRPPGAPPSYAVSVHRRLPEPGAAGPPTEEGHRGAVVR